MAKKRLTKYERILARPDKRRPNFMNEIAKQWHIPGEAMILKIKVLMPTGGEMEISWTEKDANAMAKKELTPSGGGNEK